jgi:hypothetical protein
VQLEKCGSITFRLVTADGVPHAGIRLSGRLSDKRFGKTEGWGRHLSATTDKDGRFRIEGMIPGFTYHVNTFEGPDQMKSQVLYRELSVQPGQTKDLGDIPPPPLKGR